MPHQVNARPSKTEKPWRDQRSPSPIVCGVDNPLLFPILSFCNFVKSKHVERYVGIQRFLDIKGIFSVAMKNLWEQESYPIRKKLDGCDEKYSSVTEFKQHLAANLSSRKSTYGWVFRTHETEYSTAHESYNVESSKVSRKRIPEKITLVLRKITSQYWFPTNTLVQFWTPDKVWGRCCLTNLHQPFAVGESLTKGVSWLKKKCMQHYYLADNAAKEDQLGPPGRVFLNGNPESSPDILLYSTKEFPLRDLVAGCGLKSYLALPIFDDHHNQCAGVLEFIYQEGARCLLDNCSARVDDVLQELGLRLAHKKIRQNLQCQPQPLREIGEMLDLAVNSVPQLHLAQVWVSCKQCGNNSSNIDCMVLAAYKKDTNKTKFSQVDLDEYITSEFLSASGFHRIQSGQGIAGLALSSTNKWCFCENLSAFSISEYPMKHYAQRERFSSCFVICPSSKHNGNDRYVFEFFLQPQSRDAASIQSILHMLLKIMEKKLTTFENATKQYFGVQYLQSEKHLLAIPMENYEGAFSVSEFKEFFWKTDLSCLQTPTKQVYGWICWSMKGKELSKNRGNDSSMCQLNLRKEEIKRLFLKILSIGTSNHPFLIQFWAPKITGDKSFLSTSEQPFALRHLQKGLCLYRKQCIQHHYDISDGAKEDELGPPGRVFLNGRPESSPDLRLYSKREFPLRDHVVNSGAETYLVLPLFDLLDKHCVGVLEFVGFPFYWEKIFEKLEKYNLRSTHISHPSSFPIDEGQKQAVSEIKEMLTLVIKSPQLQTALVWISCSQCSHNNIEISCMERARFSSTNFYHSHHNWRIHTFINACNFLQVQTRKGIIGKVIESESKLYFCENLCSLSICEQPLAHYAQVARLEICFAICLKSSYTGNSLYVIEFFISPHSNKYEYSRTLCFLLSTMKQMLKSFKVASGQQLDEELIFEVRELCHGMEHHHSRKIVHFASDGMDSSTCIADVNQNITGFSTANQLTVENFGGQCNHPLGIENVQYGHETEHHYSENQIHFSGIDDASNIDQEQERNIGDAINVEDKAQNFVDFNFKEGNERDRSSMSFHVSYQQLKSQFGKSRGDAAENLGVSISTLKRKCREYGIKRWPSRMNNIKNPSLFQIRANKCVENADHQTSKPSGCDLTTSDFPVQPNISSPPIQMTMEHADTCQATNVVIKAKFKDETLKFEFCISRGVEKLMEEVGKRLNLKIGAFKLKYVDDDDGDLISLPCDEDLHFFVKSMKSLGKTTVQVLVHLSE